MKRSRRVLSARPIAVGLAVTAALCILAILVEEPMPGPRGVSAAALVILGVCGIWNVLAVGAPLSALSAL